MSRKIRNRLRLQRGSLRKVVLGETLFMWHSPHDTPDSHSILTLHKLDQRRRDPNSVPTTIVASRSIEYKREGDWIYNDPLPDGDLDNLQDLRCCVPATPEVLKLFLEDGSFLSTKYQILAEKQVKKPNPRKYTFRDSDFEGKYSF